MLGVSLSTVSLWWRVIGEVVEAEYFSERKKLGGKNKVVEVDEAKFGHVDGITGEKGFWLFGAYDRETRRVAFEILKDRTSKSLLEAVTKTVKKGSTIVSDGWKSYGCLSSNGYKHLSVNHRFNYVDPDTGAHTQSVERLWREIRANIPRYGGKKEYFLEYLALYMHIKQTNPDTVIPTFFKLLAKHQASIHHSL